MIETWRAADDDIDAIAGGAARRSLRRARAAPDRDGLGDPRLRARRAAGARASAATARRSSSSNGARTISSRRCCRRPTERPLYRLEVDARRRGRILHRRLRLRAGARAARRLSAARGHAPAALPPARRAAHDATRASTACCSRSGRPTPRASRWSATSTNGTAARCQMRKRYRQRAVGDLHSRTSARARSTNTRSSAPTARSCR